VQAQRDGVFTKLVIPAHNYSTPSQPYESNHVFEITPSMLFDSLPCYSAVLRDASKFGLESTTLLRMTIESNPASRLHNLLTSLLQGNPKERVLDAWARVLQVSERPDIEVPRRLVLLNDMLDDAEQSIKLNPSLNHNVYLSCFPQVRTVFSPLHIQSSREGVILPHLTPEVMARLEFCAEALQHGWSEVEMTQDDLQEISNDLNALVESVAVSNIDVRLRKSLLEALEGVRLSISLYRIYGAKGFKKNLQGLFGLVFTEQTELKKEAKDNADLIDRLGKLMDKIDSTTATALKVHKALTKPIRFLIGLVKDSDSSPENEELPESPTTTIEV
jgi:hypothetical protein